MSPPADSEMKICDIAAAAGGAEGAEAGELSTLSELIHSLFRAH